MSSTVDVDPSAAAQRNAANPYDFKGVNVRYSLTLRSNLLLVLTTTEGLSVPEDKELQHRD